MTNLLFTPWELPHLRLPNRLVRAATYEGQATVDGVPLPALGEQYAHLGTSGVGLVITGFVAVSQSGRAMQPGQCSFANDALIAPWRTVIAQAKNACPEMKLAVQLAHAGRQSSSRVTGQPLVGASNRACRYFRQPVTALTTAQIATVIAEFAQAAARARAAGFDAVQLHAAHGYLLHQFLSPETNTRRDDWREPGRFLAEVVRAVRTFCGADFPVLLKVCGHDDFGLTREIVATALRPLAVAVTAVEVSYGTMQRPLNIFRGGFPSADILRLNPQFARLPSWARPWLGRLLLRPHRRDQISFQHNYNAGDAAWLARATGIPTYPVGGVRSSADIAQLLGPLGFPAVALCRPLLAEPELALRLRSRQVWESACVNCNRCAVACDAPGITRCYRHAYKQ